MSKGHVTYVKAHAAHNASGGGCIVYCTSRYEPGNPHSHRWHAAEQARGESRVPYSQYDLFGPAQIFRPDSSMDHLQSLQARGLAGPIAAAGAGKVTTSVSAFATDDVPFKHNAHHIIPSSNLEEAIDKVVAKAAPNEGRMRDVVVGDLLSEPYNNNDKPNMIVLPCLLKDSNKLGLPIHTDGQADHPDYRRSMETQLKARFQSAYVSLASAIKAETHPDPNAKAPAMKDTLVSLSKAVYEAIIAMGVSRKAAGRSLDEVRSQLMRMANKALSK